MRQSRNFKWIAAKPSKGRNRSDRYLSDQLSNGWNWIHSRKSRRRRAEGKCRGKTTEKEKVSCMAWNEAGEGGVSPSHFLTVLRSMHARLFERWWRVPAKVVDKAVVRRSSCYDEICSWVLPYACNDISFPEIFQEHFLWLPQWVVNIYLQWDNWCVA